MSSKGNYLKWTGRLVEEFSTKGFGLGSTSQSFYMPYHNQTLTLQQNQYQMPQNYRRYADSVDAKRNKYSSSINLHSYLSKLPFVEYNHNSQTNCCGDQYGLKKKSKQFEAKKQKACQYCQCKREARKQQKVIQTQPIIIKEIQRVFIPTPPTIIRQIVKPSIMLQQPHFLSINPQPQLQQVFAQTITRLQSQPRPASVGRVRFNYTSPNFRELLVQPQIKRSVILTPNKKEAAATPYKLLEFSIKKPQETSRSNIFDQVQRIQPIPNIVISQPWKSDMKLERDSSKGLNEDDDFITPHFMGSVDRREVASSHSNLSLKNNSRRNIFNRQPLQTFNKI